MRRCNSKYAILWHLLTPTQIARPAVAYITIYVFTDAPRNHKDSAHAIDFSFCFFLFFHLGNKKPSTSTEIVCILPFRFASLMTGRQDVIITCLFLICFLIVSVSVGFSCSLWLQFDSCPILHATNNVTPPFLFRSRYSTPTPKQTHFNTPPPPPPLACRVTML